MSSKNYIVGKIQSILKERGREKITRLAFELGLGYKHFRYYILPTILDVTECIEYNRQSNELLWTCEEEVGRVLSARPIDE